MDAVWTCRGTGLPPKRPHFGFTLAALIPKPATQRSGIRDLAAGAPSVRPRDMSAQGTRTTKKLGLTLMVLVTLKVPVGLKVPLALVVHSASGNAKLVEVRIV